MLLDIKFYRHGSCDCVTVKYDIYGNCEEIETDGILPQIVGDFTASVSAEVTCRIARR